MEEIIKKQEEVIENLKSDIKSVLNMLEGSTDRKQIANYIKEYLILNKQNYGRRKI